MLLFVTIFHMFVAILLICFVLLQDAKGGGVFGMGASGGGQVFSATGAANFFVKTTRVLAVLFAITCISLTYLTTKPSASALDGFVPPPPAATPADPAAAGATPTDGAAPATTPAKTPATGSEKK